MFMLYTVVQVDSNNTELVSNIIFTSENDLYMIKKWKDCLIIYNMLSYKIHLFITFFTLIYSS